MSVTILATKLYVPPRRSNVVVRPRLINRLNEGLQRELTLISAPAGFGKSTVVSNWVAGCVQPAAWLSLDDGDSDPTRFLAYLVAALQTIAPDFGAGLLGMLQSPQPPPTAAILTALLNEITTIPDDFILVLDDYHVIDAKPVDDILTFLLEHLPPQMHLVIATREDPPLPLARFRARGQMTELRAADLRFTAVEAADFLNTVMDLDLSTRDIAALEDRTEGWIAGLQLAALSLQGQQDATRFIQDFAGDHRYIVDYLVDEVLERQSPTVRGFLLQTALLDRLSGPLCDAVTGQAGGQGQLEALERGNFFVVPLDDQRHWYRYHHLFADVLQAQLLAEQPDLVATLHQRASLWCEQNSLSAEAIRHSLAAGDYDRAASLLELAVPALRRSRQESTLLGWLRALPDEVVRHRPVLSNVYAGVLLQSGEFEGVEARLRDAERWLDTMPETATGMVIVDDEGFRHLPGSVAVHRAGHALALGKVAETVIHARRALDLVLEDDHLGHGAAASLLGLAAWASGDLTAAHRSYAEGRASLQRAGYLSDALGCTIALADIRIVQGRLHEAMRTYEQALQLSAAEGEPVLRGTADMYVGMSKLHRERNDLPAAMRDLAKSAELGEHAALPQNRYRWRVAMARVREAEGDLDGALDLLQEAEQLYVSDLFPNVRPVGAVKARVWAAQGRMSDALNWAAELGLSAEDELSYLREFEHITLARMLLARHMGSRSDRSIQEVMKLLKRLLSAAEEGERTGRVIEILVLLALAHQTHDDIPAALIPLERALTLAEPEGYVRVFVDEGSSMAELLKAAAMHGITPDYVRQLLAPFSTAENRVPAKQDVIEPLSERELDVLRLLGTDLDGPEIAHELMVSLNTMRTHTKNIYSKLGVNNRRAAVRRAEELQLLTRPH